MEFPNLGKKCSLPSCEMLDFLPVTCIYCNQVFCKNHFTHDAHKCQLFKKDTSNLTDIKSFVCSNEKCTTSNPVEMLCQKCEKHFCLLHRYHDCFDVVEDRETKKQMWSKPKEIFDESIKIVNDSINQKINKAIHNPKKQAIALKIQLMRLKGKAEGASNIPLTDRIYFFILLPKNSSKSSKALFVSQDWSIGKVIDSICSFSKVLNKNNDLKAPKLRLFKKTDGCQVSTDTSKKISDLINSGKIVNGETLILEYIDPGENLNSFQLINFDEYNALI